ncbi:MAG: S41 family peptidase [Planctomycetota bacterium]
MPKRNLVWMAATLTAAFLVVLIFRQEETPTVVPRDERFEPLRRLDDLARRAYYHEVGPEVVEGALRGYLAALDPYCRYIPPTRPDYIDRILGGRACDVGVHYEIVSGVVEVLGPLPDSPAHRAGLRAGDRVLAINDEPLVDPTRPRVDALLAGGGDDEAPLRLRVARDEAVLEVELTVEPYPAETVVGLRRGADGTWEHLIDPDERIAYVRISEFANGTADDLDGVMFALMRKGVDGLILDLRDNPGGPLREAVEVADRFIADGLILLTRGRGMEEKRYLAHADRTYPRVDRMELVVLINHGSISAPEVVAGALRRHGRATLIGSRTFGKNLIQRSFELRGDMGSVVLTTGRYFLAEPPPPASTRSTPQTLPALEPPGIEPDVVVPVSDLDARDIAEYRYRAAALPAPRTEPAPPAPMRPAEGRLDAILRDDPPLATAVAHLRQVIPRRDEAGEAPDADEPADVEREPS